MTFICVCAAKFIKVHPRRGGEAGGGRCHTEPPGFTRLYQLHPIGTAVMNYWITPPHCHIQIHTSGDLLVHTNMFWKIQKTHQPLLIWMWSVATAWQLGASVFFCILFFEDQHFVSDFVPRLLLQGIRFLVEVAAEMCVTEFGLLCAAVSLILPVPRGEKQAQCSQHQSGKRKVCQAMVQLGPAHTHKTHKHSCSICDGHQRRAQLPSLQLNSRTAIIKCPPSPIKTNSLDCALLLSIRLTDTNDCVIHPPLPHPLLTAPVSHRALAQSTEIVSCLFLNTHLYLTAYWVSISPNVHYVWMCSWANVCGCVCVSFSSGFTSPVRHACHFRLSSPSWRCACPSSSRGDGKGWVPGRGGAGSGGS